MSKTSWLDISGLNAKLPQWQGQYLNNNPFPHIVIDDFLPVATAARIHKAFPNVHSKGWIHYLHYNENKHGLNKQRLLPAEVKGLIAELNSPGFIAFLELLTGIKGLLPDPGMEGGGIHQTMPGGFLNVHADFTVHPLKKMWRRRVNLLIYLNPGWEPSYGGQLELWPKDMSACRQQVLPLFNRCVIFNTDRHSYHGVGPVSCPPGNSRKSIALYYFTEEQHKPRLISTNYKARPGDGISAFFIWLDKKAVALYTRIKRWFGLNDDWASALLQKMKRKNN